MISKLTHCRVCGGEGLQEFLSLGETPLANQFLRKDQLNSREPRYPLEVAFCSRCGLVQLSHVVSPERMFRNYLYTSSMSRTLRYHFSQLATEAVQKFHLPKGAFVVDIGSNDGTLLKEFQAHGLRTLGIEPAANIAKMAEARKVETLNTFFTPEAASCVVETKGNADLITGTNVFAHVADLESFLRGIDRLLKETGIFLIEVPYLVDLLENTEFDTIYHEHLSYFAVRPLTVLFRKFRMEIQDIQRVPIHGGSIRVFVKRSSNPLPISDSVEHFLSLEEERGLKSLKTYQAFAERVVTIKERLLHLLEDLKSEGNRIVGYGASAKGNTLLNYCGIGPETLDYIVDNIPLKQGLYTPGMHIPVLPEEKLREDQPDMALILAWNFAEEIMEKQQEYREKGGRFIVPIPDPRIIE
jgi:2-polyprenyl-3-methyl-5-hydroxy-6-metoxy-1,4-benzoquinol methylase